MLDVILAMTKNNGIGFNGKLPWHSSNELNLFKQKTKNGFLIVGRKTYQNLPKLNNRTIIVLSKHRNDTKFQDDVSVFENIDDILTSFNYNGHNEGQLFIAGGAEIYNEVFSNWKNFINQIHLSVMNEDYKCDTFVDFNPLEWTVKTMEKFDDFTHYVLSPKVSDESQYIKLLKDVYENGSVKNGRNGETKSVFGKTMTFDLRKGFPLLTTKKMFWRGIVEELLFFIRGDTDSSILEKKKINIWTGNTSREFLDSIGMNKRRKGVMGQMYGYQWRHFNAPYDEEKAQPSEKGLDQLSDVIHKIRTDPNSRRILMTDFNPLQAHKGVLFPCHSLILQFYVDDNYLDMFCYNRSQDLVLGTPFNIASSSLLLVLVAKITNLIPRNFTLSLGDCHIYKAHYDVIEKYLTRIPFMFPTIEITKNIKEINDIENLVFSDFILNNYNSYTNLKVPMIS